MLNEDIILMFEKYSDTVYRIALNYMKNISDAEDIVQIVFMKIIENKVNFLNKNERALIIRITINVCTDLFRSKKRHKNEELTPNITFEENENNDLFLIIMSLPLNYRMVIYLHYYEGYSIKEIAAILNIGFSTVSMRLSRARKKLLKQLTNI